MPKLILFDFHCNNDDCSHRFEDMVDPSDTRTIHCPLCNCASSREISPVRIDRTSIALTPGASPESIAHFDRIHRQRKALEAKRFARNGDYGPSAGAD